VSKFSRRKLCQVFSHTRFANRDPAPSPSPPLQARRARPLCPSWESRSEPGFSFFPLPLFCPIEKSFTRPTSSPLASFGPRCCSAADDGLKFISGPDSVWTENWLGRLDRTAATNPFLSRQCSPDDTQGAKRQRDKRSTASLLGLTGARSTRLGDENRQRLAPILTTWTLEGVESWQMKQVLSTCFFPPSGALSAEEASSSPAEGGQLVYFAPADSPVIVSLFSLGPAPSFNGQQPRRQQTQRPPSVLPGNKPSGSAVVPRVHNGLEQLSLRPSAGQSTSVVTPGVVPYFGRFSRAACPSLCGCSQPSLGDGGMIGQPREQIVSPEEGRQTWGEKRAFIQPGFWQVEAWKSRAIPESGVLDRVSTYFKTWRAARNCRHAVNSARIFRAQPPQRLFYTVSRGPLTSQLKTQLKTRRSPVTASLSCSPLPSDPDPPLQQREHQGSARSIAELASCRGLRHSFHGTAAPSLALHGTNDASATGLVHQTFPSLGSRARRCHRCWDLVEAARDTDISSRPAPGPSPSTITSGRPL